MWAGIAQSVWRLSTGLRVRGSSPGGERVFPHPSRPALRPTQPPIQWVFPEGKAVEAWRWIPAPHLALRLKKKWSYTSTAPLGLCGLFWGELYLVPFNTSYGIF